MSLPDKPSWIPGGLGITLNQLFGQMRLVGFVAPDQHVGLLAEADGTIRQQLVGWDGSLQKRLLTETTGTLRAMNVGWNGAAETQFLLETSGDLRTSLVAWNGSAIQRLLTDAQGLLRARGYEPWLDDAVAELTGGAGYSTVYTSTSVKSVVEIEIVDTVGTPATDVHVVPVAGSPTNSNARIIGAAPGLGLLPYRLGQYVLGAGDMVQARNTAGGATRSNVVVWIEQYASTGDTP